MSGDNSSNLMGDEEFVLLVEKVGRIGHEPITEGRLNDLRRKIEDAAEGMLSTDLDPLLEERKVNSDPREDVLAKVEEAMARITNTPSRESLTLQRSLEQLEDIIADKEQLRITLKVEVDLQRNNLEKLKGYEDRLRILDDELMSYKERYAKTSLELKKVNPSTLKANYLLPIIEEALAQAKEDATALALLRNETLSQPDVRKEELFDKLKAISKNSSQNSKSPKYSGADEEYFS